MVPAVPFLRPLNPERDNSEEEVIPFSRMQDLINPESA